MMRSAFKAWGSASRLVGSCALIFLCVLFAAPAKADKTDEPTVIIHTPVDGATLPDGDVVTIEFELVSADGTPLMRYEVLIDNYLGHPQPFLIDPPRARAKEAVDWEGVRLLPDGAHLITIRVFDARNRKGEASITVYKGKDTGKPHVEILRPHDQEKVRGKVPITVRARDDRGIKSLVIRAVQHSTGKKKSIAIIIKPFGKTLTETKEWDTLALDQEGRPQVPDGVYRLQALAQDMEGNEGISPDVLVIVQNLIVEPVIKPKLRGGSAVAPGADFGEIVGTDRAPTGGWSVSTFGGPQVSTPSYSRGKGAGLTPSQRASQVAPPFTISAPPPQATPPRALEPAATRPSVKVSTSLSSSSVLGRGVKGKPAQALPKRTAIGAGVALLPATPSASSHTAAFVASASGSRRVKPKPEPKPKLKPTELKGAVHPTVSKPVLAVGKPTRAFVSPSPDSTPGAVVAKTGTVAGFPARTRPTPSRQGRTSLSAIAAYPSVQMESEELGLKGVAAQPVICAPRAEVRGIPNVQVAVRTTEQLPSWAVPGKPTMGMEAPAPERRSLQALLPQARQVSRPLVVKGRSPVGLEASLPSLPSMGTGLQTSGVGGVIVTTPRAGRPTVSKQPAITVTPSPLPPVSLSFSLQRTPTPLEARTQVVPTKELTRPVVTKVAEAPNKPKVERAVAEGRLEDVRSGLVATGKKARAPFLPLTDASQLYEPALPSQTPEPYFLPRSSKPRSKRRESFPKLSLKRATSFLYQVSRGENVTLLARKFGVSVREIVVANKLRAPYILKVGQKLVIPRSPAAVWYRGKPVPLLVPSFLRDGLALGPFRSVFEFAGGSMCWSHKTKCVTGHWEEKTIRLRIGNALGLVDEKPVRLSISPFLLSDRTIVPLRFFEAVFDTRVHWEQETGTVHIGTGNTATETERQGDRGR